MHLLNNAFGDGEEKMARVTGLEPAASGVTGRRSNQLSYTRVVGPRNYDAGTALSRANSHFFSTCTIFP